MQRLILNEAPRLRERVSSPDSASRAPGDAANFYQSTRVMVAKVRLKSQYVMDVAGNLFVPNELNRSSTHDRVSLIPWAKLTTFFNEHLRQRATAAAG